MTTPFKIQPLNDTPEHSHPTVPPPSVTQVYPPYDDSIQDPTPCNTPEHSHPTTTTSDDQLEV